MSCGCEGRRTGEDAKRQEDEVLERGGLRDIVEQGRGALDAGSTALTHLIKAERAEALGLGSDVVKMHRSSAERHNRRTSQQFGILAERIDARRMAGDWAALVKDTREGFRDHGGREALADAREEYRVWLFESSTLSAAVSEQALGVFDHVAGLASEGDLDRVLDFMHEQCLVAREGFAADDMGRQPAPQAIDPTNPGGKPAIAGGQNVNGWCVALAACIAWAVSSFICSVCICAAVPLCWCCFWGILFLSFGLHLASCSIAFQQACSTG